MASDWNAHLAMAVARAIAANAAFVVRATHAGIRRGLSTKPPRAPDPASKPLASPGRTRGWTWPPCARRHADPHGPLRTGGSGGNLRKTPIVIV